MAEFRMPSLGADMQEGTLVEWLVAAGDPVHRGDVVAVVDTDKAAIEVECFDDGVVEQLLVDPGQRVPVGTVLAAIGTGPAIVTTGPTRLTERPPAVAPTVGPAVAPAVPPAAPRTVSPLVRHLAAERGIDLAAVAASGAGGVVHRADLGRPGPRTGRVGRVRRASPLARRLATAAHLDLERLAGTGRDGAVTADDVRRAAALSAAPAAAAPPPVPAAPPPVPAPAPAPRAARPDGHRDAAMRHAIAELMARSNREIPHYYLTKTVDLGAATAWLRARNRELDVAARLVPAALLAAATARAAAEVHQLNGHWVDDAFRPGERVDLGLVVSLRSGGIMVPVVTDAAARTVPELMTAIRDLAGRARTGRLRASELGLPTITVSNLGDQGVDEVLGVIYPPQVALVGFGAVVSRPWAVDGLLGVRPTVTIGLAADHRASDGAVGGRFLNRIADLLQTPEEL